MTISVRTLASVLDALASSGSKKIMLRIQKEMPDKYKKAHVHLRQETKDIIGQCQQ